MKITFIRPNMNGNKSSDALQPLAIAVLDGLTPSTIETEFFDDRIETLPKTLKTDLIAISVETFTAARSYRIAKHYKAQGIPIVMGGFHPSFMPEEAKLYADSVLIGEAEDVWQVFLSDFKKGQLKPFYKSGNSCPLEGVYFRKDLFASKKYASIYPVQYSRGCRFSCDFCSISAFYGQNLRQRPLQDVVSEIQSLDQKNIFIVDDNFYVDKPKTIALLKALIPLKIKWTTQVSIDIAKDDELLELMRKSGCVAVIIGFESLDIRNLHQMGKGINIKNADYAVAIQKIRDQGIMIYGTFVFGYDYDTSDSFKINLDFALENKLMLVNFNPLMPMPGTKLYNRLLSEGRLIHEKWWLDPSFKYGDAMFHPKGMTAKALTDGCRDARAAFYTNSAIVKRAFDFKANSNLFKKILNSFLGV